MKPTQLILLSLVLIAGAAGLWWLVQGMPGAEADPSMAHDHDHGHGHEEEDEPKGPHGGRLLEGDAFSLELTLFEAGVPPEFRVFPFRQDKPLPPDQCDLTITLERFGNRTDTIRFVPAGEYLRGQQVVEEPHSFRVRVEAVHGGKTESWSFESYEGRTEIPAEAQAASGVILGRSGSQLIHQTLPVQGWVRLDRHRVSRGTARFGGVIRQLNKRIGDKVAQGEVLAVIEVNETLRPIEVRAAMAGEIVDLTAAEGEYLEAGSPVCEIADLGLVWMDLQVPIEELPRVRRGQPVEYATGDSPESEQGEIAYIAPVGNPESQTVVARIEVRNEEGRYRPGQHVSARIVVEEERVAVAVPETALQTFRDWDVVFLADGTVFQAQPVETGRRDGRWVEILGGLEAGQTLVVSNSFLIKADVLKSGASHDH